MGKGVFSWCESMVTADISAYTGALPAQTFYYASALAGVTFGSGLTSIGADCFTQTALTSLDLSGTRVTSIGDRAFAGCGSLKTAVLGDIASLGNGVFAASGSPALESVRFGEGSTVLGTNTLLRPERARHRRTLFRAVLECPAGRRGVPRLFFAENADDVLGRGGGFGF